MLRVQLWNKNIGSVTLRHDPDGLSEVEQIVKRSKKSDGIFYEITLDLKFIKEGRLFIQSVYETEGIEGIIIVNLFKHDPNSFKQRIYYTGKIALKRYIITETELKTNIEQTGFEIKVMNLTDVDVDVETLLSQSGSGIPETELETITFHAKKIVKEMDAGPTDSLEFQQLDVFDFEFQDDGGSAYRDGVVIGNVASENFRLQELENLFTLPWGYIYAGSKGSGTTVEEFLMANPDPRNEIYSATEAGVMSVDIRLRLKHDVYARNDGGDVDINGSGVLGNVRIAAWFEWRDVDNNIKSLVQIGTEWDMPGLGGYERLGNFETKEYSVSGLDIVVGDKIFVYFTGRIYGTYEEPNEGAAGHGFVWHEFRVTPDVTIAGDGRPNTYLYFKNDTEFPESTADCAMVFEALNKTAQYMTDQQVAFESEFFGRTDSVIPYPEDGPGSLIAITSGGKIRKLENGKIFINWTDIFESLSARHCLGWGVRKNAAGVSVITVEPKEFFWNKNSKILEFGCVSDLEKSVTMDYYHTQVEYGYPKLDVGQLNGLDEFNTTRREKLPITQTNSKLVISSKYKTSGYEIETQRRLIESTKDSKLDSANFMVNVIRDGDGFRTARNENYPVVENLYDPDSAYNLYFAPGRMIRTWLKVLASNVIKGAEKSLKFTFGDGNFNLISRETSEPEPIAENADVSMADVEPLWENEVYKFSHPLDGDEMTLIRENPYGYIRFRDNLNNIKDGYVLEVRHDPNAEMGDFTLLKVFRPVN